MLEDINYLIRQMYASFLQQRVDFVAVLVTICYEKNNTYI